MKNLRNIVAAALSLGIAIGLGACAPTVIPEPDHKAKTTACLIRSSTVVPGTPEKQLAADLVEAKIVFGLAVREVKIDQQTQQVSARLLQALQAGCVLMVSANPEYLSELAKFALNHPRMMVLFVGGEISSTNQPANLRWVADDVSSAARLAGFFAAGKSTSGEVHLFIQPVYDNASLIQKAFRQGVRAFDQLRETSTKTVVVRTSTAGTLSAKLESLDSTQVAVIYGGKSIWKDLVSEISDGPFIVGADLQLGNTPLVFESRVQASVERNTSKYVLNAVADLLSREFGSEPLYRKPGALKFSTVELRISQPDSLPGSLLEELATYRQNLITPANP